MKPIRVALIPAHEPDEILAKIVHKLSLRDFFIVVVNDGSSGSCDLLFEEIAGSAVVLKHPEPLGRGAALRTGLSYLREHFPFHYTVVTLDADGHHRICDAERVCREAEAHPGTLVLGTRDPIKGGGSVRMRLGLLLSGVTSRLTAGVSVRDPRSRLRACSDDVVRELLSLGGKPDRFEKAFLRHCARRHIPVQQVTVRTVVFAEDF